MTVTVQGHLRFCLNLTRRLSPDRAMTVCWSPYSVACALGLAMDGARGTTRKELAHVLLGDSVASPTTLAGLLQQAAALPRRPGAEGPLFTVANTLWIEETLPLHAQHADTGPGIWPGQQVRTAPFAHAPDYARQEINRSVSLATEGLIDQLLDSKPLPTDTVAALVNTLYVQTSWASPFPKRLTAPAPFATPGGTTTVDMMQMTAPMGYAHAHGWQLVELAAAGDIAATVLLPNDPLDVAEAHLSPPLLAAVLAAQAPQRVQLSLPRIVARCRPSLVTPLSEEGARTMFTPDADFSRLTQGPLMISAAIHETVLEVDERGLSGAAGTALAVSRAMKPSRAPVTVTVNRPFFLLVRHRVTGIVYFFARITVPSKTRAAAAPSRGRR